MVNMPSSSSSGNVGGVMLGDIYLNEFLLHFTSGGIVYDYFMMADTHCFKCGKAFLLKERFDFEIADFKKDKEDKTVVLSLPVHRGC